jgi:sarcosine/dimethylglycine N-methyltransferase
MAVVDLTEEYCATARWPNQLAGLDDRITVRQADVTDLPFEDATFTLMFSQHVQMNVADKLLLYEEARRVPGRRRQAGCVGHRRRRGRRTRFSGALGRPA